MVKEDEYLLTNQEILGGIKAALERGQTLKQAMMSFYQAGYKKEEIEDAARAYLYLQKGNSEVNVLSSAKNKVPDLKKDEFKDEKKINVGSSPEEKDKKKEESKSKGFFAKKEEKNFSTVEKNSVPTVGSQEKEKQSEKKVVQKISGYEENKDLGKFKSKAVTSVLVITLIVLLGILALVFLFKAELVNFINGLFG